MFFINQQISHKLLNYIKKVREALCLCDAVWSLLHSITGSVNHNLLPWWITELVKRLTPVLFPTFNDVLDWSRENPVRYYQTLYFLNRYFTSQEMLASNSKLNNTTSLSIAIATTQSILATTQQCSKYSLHVKRGIFVFYIFL